MFAGHKKVLGEPHVACGPDFAQARAIAFWNKKKTVLAVNGMFCSRKISLNDHVSPNDRKAKWRFEASKNDDVPHPPLNLEYRQAGRAG